jgi:hypothetical protein
MPRRITKAFFAAAAAGATITTLGFAAASPAGAAVSGKHFTGKFFTPSAPQVATDASGTAASTPPCGAAADVRGTWSPTDCGKAGYVATGRDFRFASAILTIPNKTGSVATDPMIYVALDASAANNDFARVGVEPCTVGIGGTCPAGDTSGWEAFSQIQEPGSATINDTAGIASSLEGDGVTVSAYLVPTGNSVHFVVTSPSLASIINTTDNVSGPVYTDAQAFADWTTATARPAPVPPVDDKFRDTQFFQGRFTTVSGAQGTFNGPWTLTAVDATSNGTLPPTGSLIAQPSFLWNDGSGFNKMGDDAFGVWRYPF